MAVTRDDVARLAGVSTATVSYVINNGPRPVSEETRAKALHRLAYRVHEQQGIAAERTDAPADISEGDVLAAFAPLLPEDVNPRLVLEYLETRAGLLVSRAPGVYAFPHHSFQEYLTACHLADVTETHWRAAILAAQALVDLRFPEAAESKPDFDAALRRVRRRLVVLVECLGTERDARWKKI